MTSPIPDTVQLLQDAELPPRPALPTEWASTASAKPLEPGEYTHDLAHTGRGVFVVLMGLVTATTTAMAICTPVTPVRFAAIVLAIASTSAVVWVLVRRGRAR